MSWFRKVTGQLLGGGGGLHSSQLSYLFIGSDCRGNYALLPPLLVLEQSSVFVCALPSLPLSLSLSILHGPEKAFCWLKISLRSFCFSFSALLKKKKSFVLPRSGVTADRSQSWWSNLNFVFWNCKQEFSTLGDGGFSFLGRGM